MSFLFLIYIKNFGNKENLVLPVILFEIVLIEQSDSLYQITDMSLGMNMTNALQWHEQLSHFGPAPAQYRDGFKR